MTLPNRPKIIDLFAGVGGFSLGAERAGFEVAAAVELDRNAISAHSVNFRRAQHARRNVMTLSGEDLKTLAGVSGSQLDGLIGGPPCQGFSTMGKMRKNDARNKLFYHFFRLVSEANPLFFVAENVPGILEEKYNDLRNESFKLLEKQYYVLPPVEISAADCGAATARTRLFFVGWLKASGLSLNNTDFTLPKKTASHISAAFSGLPEQICNSWTTPSHTWQKIAREESPYLACINRFLSDIGDETALRHFENERRVSGFLATRHSPAVVERFSEVKPGKSDSVSKYPRLRWDAPCPTLRAGTGKDRGSYQAARPIHPTQNRVITTREAARIQAFPDWFQFDATKWHSFRQIGNSVSPLVAEAVLRPLIKQFN